MQGSDKKKSLDGTLKRSEVLVETINYKNEAGEDILIESFSVDRSCVNHIVRSSSGNMSHKLRVNGKVVYVTEADYKRIVRLFDDNRYMLDMRTRIRNKSLQKQIHRQEVKLRKMKKEKKEDGK